MSQLERRMRAALPATISLIASGALHVLVVVALARSASGAEPARDELDPARFVGNTFEIETVDAPLTPAAPPLPAAPPTPTAAPEPAAPPLPKPAEKAPSPPDDPSTRAAHSAQVASQSPSAPTPPAPARAESPVTASAERAAPDGAQTATTGVVAPSYGQDALPASTASLAKAFTRAVPRIASSDQVWHGLPLGAAGKAVFSIEVDAQGKVVGQGTVLDEPAPAPHLERIIGRTVLLLKSQTFTAFGEAGRGGTQRFELTADIRQVAPLEDAFAEPRDLRQIGRLVEPTRVRPGKANFTYNSGRQVELTLRLLAQ